MAKASFSLCANLACIAAPKENPANTTFFLDIGLIAHTTYSYRIRAGNVAGYSSYSATASATTLLGLPGTPGPAVALADSGSQITVTWVDTASNETGFTIERSSDGGAVEEIAAVAANVGAYIDQGLAEISERRLAIGFGPERPQPLGEQRFERQAAEEMRLALGAAEHGVHQLAEVLAAGVALGGFDSEEQRAVVAQFRQVEQLREAEPQEGLERAALFRNAAIEIAGNGDVELAVAAERRGDQPVGGGAIAPVGNLGDGKGGEVRPLEHARQPVGCGDPKRQPRWSFLFLQKSLSPRVRASRQSSH